MRRGSVGEAFFYWLNMHYYSHNISDFNSATRHLTRVEISVYRDLIDLYYEIEQPLNFVDFNSLARRVRCKTKEETDALQAVLEEFFVLTDNGYSQIRCDAEIAKYRANTSAKAQAGVASAAAKKAKKEQSQQNSTRVEQNVNETQLTNKLITNNQEPIIKGTNVPLCPQQKIKDLYVEKLSEWLPSIKIWSDARAKALQARWKFMLTASRSDGTRFANNEEEGLAMFAKFFDFVAASDFLCGRKDGSGFVADIDFLLTQSKFIRVIEGFYSNKNNEAKS